MKNTAPQLIGVGELVFDHIILHNDHTQTYLGSRGGGSVWNCLVNFVNAGGTGKTIGIGGNDSFGLGSKEDLKKFGVDVTGIYLMPRHTTRVIFHEIFSER